LSLNLRDDELEYFVERSRKHVTNLVALQYDVSEARRTKTEKKEKKKKKKDDDDEHDEDDEDDDDLLVRPHTDPTDFTCLFFDEDDGPNGLQILTEESWIDVPLVPNAMLVNVGDVLMAWTNGEYKSSRHRVVLRDSTSNDKRMSLVWFHCPNYDALIDSRDVTARKKKSSSSNAPPKYAPFLCKDRTHFQQTERTKLGLKDRQLTSDLDSSVRGLDVENNSHHM
jgi:isopenicillin N synthase-like dioxygenase